LKKVVYLLRQQEALRVLLFSHYEGGNISLFRFFCLKSFIIFASLSGRGSFIICKNFKEKGVVTLFLFLVMEEYLKRKLSRVEGGVVAVSTILRWMQEYHDVFEMDKKENPSC
jgi:hypothetical protein